MSSPVGCRPIIQVHPSRRCNLRCAHCYTSSGPNETATVALDALHRAVADAAALGYEQCAVSGGEPFLWESLPTFLESAKRVGLMTSVTTNGLLLTPTRLAAVEGHLDVLAVSVDGPPEHHDLMRQRDGAFVVMRRRLANIRSCSVPFGMIFTLTRFNADHLEWLAEFAVNEGASFVQIHPLTSSGRARTTLDGAEPDAIELAAALVEITQLRDTCPDLDMRLDATTRVQLDSFPDHLITDHSAPLASIVPNLIVDDQGNVIPYTHDVHPSFWLGSLHDAPLGELASRWRATNGRRCERLLAATHTELTRADAPPITYWPDTLAALSNHPRQPARQRHTGRPRHLAAIN